MKKNSLYRLANLLYYGFKRNNWMFDLSRFWDDFDSIEIDRPIFFLGTHGGGLTLISRMLRRNKNVLSVSGNYKYWSGADEMQVVLGPILPFELSGIKHNVPQFDKFGFSKFKTETTWLYATNELISWYRKDEKDVTPKIRKKLKKIIRWSINRHAINKSSARFTDKSQVYTVKVSFLNEILKDSNPKFILITRNPYAICYRAPSKAGGLKKINSTFSFKEKVELAAQHWANSMKYALEDKDKIDNFLRVRFEDVLNKPKKYFKMICDFAEIEFNEDMLPQSHHEIPFGSRYNKKWYPLRPEVNKKHFEKMKQEHVEIIDKYCHKYAEEFGYEKPNI